MGGLLDFIWKSAGVISLRKDRLHRSDLFLLQAKNEYIAWLLREHCESEIMGWPVKMTNDWLAIEEEDYLNTVHYWGVRPVLKKSDCVSETVLMWWNGISGGEPTWPIRGAWGTRPSLQVKLTTCSNRGYICSFLNLFRSLRTSCTSFGWFVPSVRPVCKKNLDHFKYI